MPNFSRQNLNRNQLQVSMEWTTAHLEQPSEAAGREYESLQDRLAYSVQRGISQGNRLDNLVSSFLFEISSTDFAEQHPLLQWNTLKSIATASISPSSRVGRPYIILAALIY